MRATFTRKSNKRAVLASMKRADRAGLLAGGRVLLNGVKRGLRGGYTSGDFVTGRVLNSVRLSEPRASPDGGTISVYSDLLYALYWELGHLNLFTANYERVQVWVPAFRENRVAAKKAYVQAYRALMGTGPRAVPSFGAIIDGIGLL